NDKLGENDKLSEKCEFEENEKFCGDENRRGKQLRKKNSEAPQGSNASEIRIFWNYIASQIL
ncbi:MAG: hypothetical protein MK515_06930, partial [SAR324 cluster bacterium]|nr:hypothetical protein [SAR324 cluster bacterium]